MERTQTRSISRRSFIGGMTGAGALAALGLAGCAPKTAGSAEADKLSEAGAQGVADNSVVAVDDGSAANHGGLAGRAAGDRRGRHH